MLPVRLTMCVRGKQPLHPRPNRPRSGLWMSHLRKTSLLLLSSGLNLVQPRQYARWRAHVTTRTVHTLTCHAQSMSCALHSEQTIRPQGHAVQPGTRSLQHPHAHLHPYSHKPTGTPSSSVTDILSTRMRRRRPRCRMRLHQRDAHRDLLRTGTKSHGDRHGHCPGIVRVSQGTNKRHQCTPTQ